MSSPLSHQQLAGLLGGTLVKGDPAGVVTGLNSIAEAAPGEVTFLGNAKYTVALRTSRATAVLVDAEFNEFAEGVAYIVVENPTLAFSVIVRHFSPPPRPFSPGVHPSAVVSLSARFDPGRVSIAPSVVIEDGVTIGPGTAIHAGVVIGHGARIGSDCILHTNCSVRERCLIGDRVIIHCNATIGADGFGFQFVHGKHTKVEQVGIVQIDHDVEVGANTTIDRARFGRTWIGEGTKIDNLVQIGHNVIIGKHCIICGQVGISGSVRIGDFVTMAGQVGVAGHIRIGDKITLLAQAGVVNDLLEPGIYIGHPAQPVQQGRKSLVLSARLPDLLERLKQLEKKVGSLESN